MDAGAAELTRFDALAAAFADAADPERVAPMAKYMKDHFAFFGIPADRLFRYCLRRAGDSEFFIRKAIGWARREYAKTDPDAVADFVHEHEAQLSPLSRREASAA